MTTFKTGKCKIMVATDVAQRGLDIRDIQYVINFDFPKNMEDYAHRIGRTGRAGALGISISFLTQEEDANIAKELIEFMIDSE